MKKLFSVLILVSFVLSFNFSSSEAKTLKDIIDSGKIVIGVGCAVQPTADVLG